MEPAPAKEWFSSGQVVQLLATVGVKATYRQLDYWCHTGVFSDRTPGSGNRRVFDVLDVEVAMVAAQFSEFGAQSEHMRAVAELVRARKLKPSTGVEAFILSVDGVICQVQPAYEVRFGHDAVGHNCWVVLHERATLLTAISELDPRRAPLARPVRPLSSGGRPGSLRAG